MAVWFLAQIRPNADQIAKRNLHRQGFGTFQPMEVRSTVRRGRFIQQARPFFPGYLFVSRTATCAPWSLVNSTYGVSRLVRFGDRPLPVPASVMTDLFDACDENEIMSMSSMLAVGDQVEVLRGPLMNLAGELERLIPDQRAIILIDIMGKQTRVTLNREDLCAPSGTHSR